MQKEQLLKLKVKNIVKSFLDEKITPKDIRLQAAKGLIPLQTNELITTLYYLRYDSEEDIKSSAKESIKRIPDSMLKGYLALRHPAEILDYFAKLKAGDDQFLQVIILNKSTSNDTIKSLAGNVTESLATIIAQNQERIIQDPEIFDCLEKNGNVSASVIEGLRTFLKSFGGESKETEEFKEFDMDELFRLKPEEPEPPIVTEPVEAEEEEPEEPEDYEQEQVKMPSKEELINYSDQEVEELKLNLYQRIQSMSVAEKIQEALKGSREARGILIKESNKLVSTAVIKSPKITEDEIVKVSASRSVSEEVLRLICRKKEWTKNYQVKVNLVNNPKTPLPVSMRFLPFVQKRDLGAIARSKMIPSVLVMAAKKMLQKKR